MKARDRLALGSLIAILVVTRLAWLAWNPESAGYWEEAQRWMAAHEILGDRTLPVIEYQADHYQGGSLVMVALCLPFLALFGESLLTLKLSALLFSIATLCAVYVCCRVGAGRTAAILAGLGYLAGPPVVAYWGLVPFGSHQESTLFSAVGLTLMLGLLQGRRSTRHWFVFGLVSGLGVWFCYTAGLALVAFALAWLLIERIPKRNEVLWLFVGGIVGLLPWIAYNLQHGFAGVARIGHLLGIGNPINVWEQESAYAKLAHLVSRDLPVGLLFPYTGVLTEPGVLLLAIAFALPIVIAIGVAVVGIAKGRGRTRPLDLVFVSYFFVFGAVYLVSDFSVEPDQGAVAYRLFLPLATFSMCLGAVVAARAIRETGPKRSLALTACACHLIASATGTVLLAARTPNDDQRVTADSGYFVHGLLMYRKYEEDLSRPLAYARGVPSGKLRNLALVGIGLGLEYRFEKNGTAEELNEKLLQLDPAERTRVITGIYSGLDFRRASLRARRVSGLGADRDTVIAKRLEVLEQMVDNESNQIPDRFWPLGGNRRSPAGDPSRPPAEGT